MKSKNMRRVAVIVLAIALLTTTIFCGTLAKYTSTFTGSGSALTAATWAPKVGTDGTVADTDFTFTWNTLATETSKFNNVAAGKIAPGTSDFAEIALNNEENEVAATYVLTVTAISNNITNAKVYIQLNSGDKVYVTNDNKADAATKVEVTIPELTAGTNNFVVGYEWAYETANGDAADTINGTTTVGSISVTVKVVATQVNPADEQVK